MIRLNLFQPILPNRFNLENLVVVQKYLQLLLTFRSIAAAAAILATYNHSSSLNPHLAANCTGIYNFN